MLDNETLVDLLQRRSVLLLPAELRLVEEALSLEPANLKLRELLLRHYCVEKARPRFVLKLKLRLVSWTKGLWTTIAARKHTEQVLWVIRNVPGSHLASLPIVRVSTVRDPIGATKARIAWKQLIDDSPTNTELLRNAANCLVDSDPIFSMSLLLAAQSIDPESLEWTALIAEQEARHSFNKGNVIKALIARSKWHQVLARQIGHHDHVRQLQDSIMKLEETARTSEPLVLETADPFGNLNWVELN